MFRDKEKINESSILSAEKSGNWFGAIVLNIFISGLTAGIISLYVWQLMSYQSKQNQDQPVNSTGVINEIIPEIVAEAKEAVVSIVVTKDVPVYERYYQYFRPDFWGGQQVVVPQLRQLGTREEEVGGGTGFFINKSGRLVTNTHVVADPEARYSIILNDGSSMPVRVLYRDKDIDIAILEVENPSELAGPVAYLSWANPEYIQVGQTAIVIGNALAEFQNSVSVGVVSGLSRTIIAKNSQGQQHTLSEVIQTDAAINPGNSGGPLLNLAGEVIGVNVATTSGVDNISFAIPVQVVKQVLEQVL